MTVQAITFFASVMNTNSIQLCLCCSGAICCFIPLMLHPPAIMGETALKIAPTSLQNRDSAIAALALTAPIVMELAAEFVLSCIRRNDAKKADVLPDQELLNPTERLVLVFGILTIPIAALMPSEILNLVYVDTCLRKCRSMLVTGVIIVSLCRNDPQIWSVRITYLVLVLLVVGAVTGAFAADVKITKSIGTAFYTCGITVFFFCNARWVYSVLPELSKVLTLSNAVQGISLREESAAGITEILFMLLYIGTITTVTMILIAVNVIFPGIGFFTPNAAFYNNIAFVLYLLFMMYISKRKMKYKMLQGLVRSPSYAFTEILFTHTANFLFVLFNPKYALIESKKMYVRYISHELRTPLNSAFLGLKLVSDDLMTSTDDKDSDHFETLLCVKSACRTAVELLNDLLCFDKLESGILEMHKHDVSVIPFITDCVNMFSSQAREAGVTITNTTRLVGGSFPFGNLSNATSLLVPLPGPGPEPTHTYTMTDLLQDDTVVMDKFKMDQVLRNLISNALKFTPRGGSVTVCASFVPNRTGDSDNALRLESSVGAGGVSTDSPCPAAPPSILWASMAALQSRVMGSLQHFNGLVSKKSKVHISVNGILDDLEANNDDLLDPLPDDDGRQSAYDDVPPFGEMPGDGTHSSSSTTHGLLSDVMNLGKVLDLSDISNSVMPNNVIDVSPGGSSPSSLTITGKLRIVVTDTGVGLSEVNQLRLFNEIVQFSPEVLQAGGGSGLGLWITSSIVQMHSGTIHAYSAGANKGSTFSVEIDMQRRVSFGPLTQASPPSCAFQRPDNEEHSGAIMALDYSKALEYVENGINEDALSPYSVLRARRSPPILDSESFRLAASEGNNGRCLHIYDVLVVDDTSLNRKLLCKLLRASGHSCEEAVNGLCAVEKVTARMSGVKLSYDAILMDFEMPIMDGPTATEAIRRLGYSGPIFGVTGNTLDSDVNHFISHGADAVLSKPFDYKRFKQLMAEFQGIK